ncbi:MAG: helix-turn-helix domain-containing protein, partial [Myxococcota bacterium]
LQARGLTGVTGNVPLPESLTSLLRSRLAALSTDARDVVIHAAAVSEPTAALLEAAIGAERARAGLAEARNAAVLAAGDEIDAADLRLAGAPVSAATSTNGALPFAEAKRSAVEGFERDFLLRALRANGGNVSRTAEAIGMVRQSLQQKIRELGLRDEDWKRSAHEPNGGGRA